MKAKKSIPKVLGAIAILLFGPLLAVLIAFFLAMISLPQDPNFVSNGGHAAPGDGILILVYVFISLVVSVPLSIWGAVLFLFRTGRQAEP